MVDLLAQKQKQQQHRAVGDYSEKAKDIIDDKLDGDQPKKKKKRNNKKKKKQPAALLNPDSQIILPASIQVAGQIAQETKEREIAKQQENEQSN